ncbi:hypothetical protein ABIA32_005790 [Streptacidiphilus sp. MAP12-20]
MDHVDPRPRLGRHRGVRISTLALCRGPPRDLDQLVEPPTRRGPSTAEGESRRAELTVHADGGARIICLRLLSWRTAEQAARG